MNIKSYFYGFAMSLIVTLLAYIIVDIHVASEHLVVSHEAMPVTLLTLASIQLVIQLKYFLHLGGKSGWNLVFFTSTAAVILIIAVASLWIMTNLNYNMTPEEMGEYLIEREGISE